MLIKSFYFYSSSSYSRKCLDEKKSNILAKIRRDDIVSELHLRDVEFKIAQLKDDLLPKLVEEMAGIQRLPALMFHVPRRNLAECHLEKYEIVTIEPLHAVKGHIANLYELLPSRLTDKDEKNLLQDAIDVSFKKDAKTGADYRKSLVDVCGLVHNKIDPDIYQVMLQLVEIQEVIYLNENDRTNSRIFRYHNTAFLHALAVKEILPSPKKIKKKISSRKLHGQYIHSLTGHGPMWFRIVSLPSINAEDEERIFCPLKKLAIIASNHHPDNVLINLFIRYQIRGDFHAEVTYNENIEHDKYVSTNKDLLPPFKPSLIPFEIIESKPWTYQSHLEEVADFLLFENAWSETKRGILFHDLNEDLFTEKEIHHFRYENYSRLPVIEINSHPPWRFE